MTIDRQLLKAAGAAALLIAMTACGGGGNDEPGETSATPAVTSGFNTSAYLKTVNTIRYDGQRYGLNGTLTLGLIDQCNALKAFYYELPPDIADEAMLAKADVYIREKYFDRDKARTDDVMTGVILPDLERWKKDFVATGTAEPPAVPLSCATKLVESRRASIWRDGLRYELNYSTLKATGGVSTTTTPTPFPNTDLFKTFPAFLVAGQVCHVIPQLPGTAPGTDTCIWNLFPFVSYLNWPFALSGRAQFGPVEGKLYETIDPIEARQGMAIDPEVFEIPSDFTVSVN